ncbi:MAG: class I SAM-dependent methyltransferase [Desulfovibrionaceae bacterium]|nr:class I SAM-dependent methyltransferase [Desulfovibrionaceae bacterium]
MNVCFPKGSVEGTLLPPLYAKAWCAKKYPDIFTDRESVDILGRVGYDFSNIESQNPLSLRMGALTAGLRQYAIASELARALKDNPRATLVNLGCGLDTTGHLVDTGECRFLNLDLHDVILLREEFIPSNDREQNRVADLSVFEGLDSWFDIIDETAHTRLIFFAAGVFLYMDKITVLSLIAAMAERFPGSRLIFDAQNALGTHHDLKDLAKAGINVSTNFFLSSPKKELKAQSPYIVRVESRGMSTGYRKLDHRFGLLFSLIAHAADFTRMSQIHVVDFA